MPEFYYVTQLAHSIHTNDYSKEYFELIGTKAESYKEAVVKLNQHLLAGVGGIENDQEIDYSKSIEEIAAEHNLLFVNGRTLIYVERDDNLQAGLSHTASVTQHARQVTLNQITFMQEWSGLEMIP